MSSPRDCSKIQVCEWELCLEPPKTFRLNGLKGVALPSGSGALCFPLAPAPSLQCAGCVPGVGRPAQLSTAQHSSRLLLCPHCTCKWLCRRAWLWLKSDLTQTSSSSLDYILVIPPLVSSCTYKNVGLAVFQSHFGLVSLLEVTRVKPEMSPLNHLMTGNWR